MIRDAQWAALIRSQDHAYAHLLAERLRRDNPGICADLEDRQLTLELCTCVAKARAHGLREGLDVMAYFAASRRFSARFDESPSVLGLLSDIRLPPWQRLQNILQLPLDTVLEELRTLPVVNGIGGIPCR
jgi:hypothetical protein